MPDTSTITPEQLDEFNRRGVLRVPSLIAADRVRRAREHIQLRLERSGLWKNGQWNLSDAPRPRWPDTGLKTSKVIGNKHPHIEALFDEPTLLCAVEALLEGHAFDRTLHKRPQILLTLPNSDNWTVPTNWHADVPRLVSGRCPGIQLFTFLEKVEPRGGGTLVLAGSHRLLNEGHWIRVKDLKRHLCRDPFFHTLYCEATADARARLLGQTGVIGDIALQVLELTGAPGDVYFTDLRLLHTGAPNAADHPRMMATHRFVRVDVMQELAEAIGIMDAW